MECSIVDVAVLSGSICSNWIHSGLMEGAYNNYNSGPARMILSKAEKKHVSKLMTKHVCHTELHLCGIFFTSAQLLNKLIEESCIQTTGVQKRCRIKEQAEKS